MGKYRFFGRKSHFESLEKVISAKLLYKNKKPKPIRFWFSDKIGKRKITLFLMKNLFPKKYFLEKHLTLQRKYIFF